MDISQLKLTKGQWIVANCGKYPSEKNCKMVFMAPEDQRKELLDTVVRHAIEKHGHNDAPELRTQINQLLEMITVK